MHSKGRGTIYENLPTDEGKGDRTALSVEDIIAFADIVELSDVAETLERQIAYNMAIAEEGMKNSYGANVGKVLLRSYQPDIKTTAKAYAAASDSGIICDGQRQAARRRSLRQ